MLAREADQLKKGDRVLALNGSYTQDSIVVSVMKDHRNVRWITYKWVRKGETYFGRKRHNSVYLPSSELNS